VHDAILEDLCYPSEIVGKRIRIKLDGTRLIKVHLDKAQQTNVEHKVNCTVLFVLQLNAVCLLLGLACLCRFLLILHCVSENGAHTLCLIALAKIEHYE